MNAGAGFLLRHDAMEDERMKRLVCAAVLLSAGVCAGQKGEARGHVFFSSTDVKATEQMFTYKKGKLPIVSGHRGGDVAGYPENSIAAFEHALGAAPMMFETDPHMTKDGQIVIMHDATLDRTTAGHGKVKDFTLAEVQAVGMKDFAGSPVKSVHPPSLKEAILWAKGKTVLNLDIKDVPHLKKAALVKDLDAFAWTMFTVHKAAEAKEIYDFDHRAMFAAVIFTEDDLKSYEAAGIPWTNVAIAYVGSKNKPENKDLYAELHKRGRMVMVACSPSYDKLPTEAERAAAYKQIIADGADVIESDHPIEVAAALGKVMGKR